MKTYARIINNVAIEIFIPQEGFTLEESFHPTLVEMFSEVPNGTVVNSEWDGDEWVAPTPQEPQEPQ